jgi:hypothetical protein
LLTPVNYHTRRNVSTTELIASSDSPALSKSDIPARRSSVKVRPVAPPPEKIACLHLPFRY